MLQVSDPPPLVRQLLIGEVLFYWLNRPKVISNIVSLKNTSGNIGSICRRAAFEHCLLCNVYLEKKKKEIFISGILETTRSSLKMFWSEKNHVFRLDIAHYADAPSE